MILGKVKKVIEEQLGISESEITLDAKFEKWYADELDVAEIVMDCEDIFNIEIPDEALEKVQTVGDLVDYITSHT